MQTIGVVAILLSILMTIKISSSCFTILSAIKSYTLLSGVFEIFVISALVLGVVTGFISYAITADLVGSTLSEHKLGSDFMTVFGFVGLALSSFLCLTFPWFVSFLFPFLATDHRAAAKKSLPLLTGPLFLIIELVTLIASILGIISFYMTHVAK